ncbi:EAL and HDOD domain-containing protein [Acetobacterium tundrae]|uniref:EAL domain-containing protein n=1 Tax=Acetobacterium tundrae TaxID=132932 RepID=A0ABR6WQF9_9FIRM|nr:EAL domain-containing protein [Acetobacterium tundrae]MBC3798568.1 EAL domain-containing protein [Acetobacterium tundrae]
MFIARQPIFNQQLEVFGYELLFRLESQSTQFGGISSQGATATVITGLYESGLENLIEDKYAFINFDEIFVHSNALELIEPDRMIVEMLENIKIDRTLMDRLEEIRHKGYKIALDDFKENYCEYPLTPFADIIKYDLMATPLERIEKDVIKALSQNKILLAEKVETEKEYLEAKEMGFQLFQGYFFSRPSIAAKSYNKTTSKSQYVRVIAEIKKVDPDFDALAELLEQDVTLAYRVMRMASFRSGNDLVSSVKYALTYMGLDELERWINVIMLQDLGKDKPEELKKISLIRTKFAESIAIHGGMKKLQNAASMMGLFSVLDAILDQSMEEALMGVALPPSILDALINHKGVLYPIYELILSYEKGDWNVVDKISKELNLEETVLVRNYRWSIQWANEIMILVS